MSCERGKKLHIRTRSFLKVLRILEQGTKVEKGEKDIKIRIIALEAMVQSILNGVEMMEGIRCEVSY
ncbi:MAG: hypothetical protein HUJ74_04560 [Lachnospiraceae bacterium]|nr:hypothetical protein [Lachnospiraceae bacterium]